MGAIVLEPSMKRLGSESCDRVGRTVYQRGAAMDCKANKIMCGSNGIERVVMSR